MGTALIIDPDLEIVECNLRRLGGLGLELRYVIETHMHVGHTIPRGPFSAQQSPLPRSRAGLRKIRVEWNKDPSRVFSSLGVRLRPTRAPQSSRTAGLESVWKRIPDGH
jgi:glyoxylase-like metal-dependent hydrolase (beta-lactamase superfamily II)